MEEVIKELKNGNEKELREHFFKIMRDLQEKSYLGLVSWAEVNERINQELILNNQMVDKYWLK